MILSFESILMTRENVTGRFMERVGAHATALDLYCQAQQWAAALEACAAGGLAVPEAVGEALTAADPGTAARVAALAEQAGQQMYASRKYTQVGACLVFNTTHERQVSRLAYHVDL